MAVNNSLQRRGNGDKPKFSIAIQTPMYQKLVNDTLGDPEHARRFVAAITSAVAVNPSLQSCDAGTVLSAALLGESLNLSPSPQLGQYYMVPYNDKKRGPIAQFQLGYKGYIQLAERSGQYLDIDAFPVVEGEYKDLLLWKGQDDQHRPYDSRWEIVGQAQEVSPKRLTCQKVRLLPRATTKLCAYEN